MMKTDTSESPARKKRARRPHKSEAPGTLVSDPNAPRPVVHVMGYGPEELHEEEVRDLATLAAMRGKWPVLWVNVDGVRNAETIARLGEIFGLHRLALEDVTSVHQRPKAESYGECLFVVARMIFSDGRLGTEQISMFLARDFLLTFQERPGDCFDPVRDRIRKGQGRIREMGHDYLAYSLLDSLVDSYFPVLEDYGERLEDLEKEVITVSDEKTITLILGTKRDLLTLRRTLWPMRDLFNSLLRDTTAHFAAETQIYLRDCYDHTFQVIDMLETFRESASGLLDVYLSSVSNRMNSVMKVLTIIATIFMPLSFIAGVYGMNFSPQKSPWNMPELNWYWGYPFALTLMLLVLAGMLYFFRRKRWI
jgi:magnesium transporter